MAAAFVCLVHFSGIEGRSFAGPLPSPNPPMVLNLSIVRAERAATLVRALYPHARLTVELSSNALIVQASPDDLAAIRSVVAGIDVKDPSAAAVDAIQLHSSAPEAAVARLHAIFPKARFAVAPNHTVVIAASALDMTQVKAILTAIDTPPAAATPKPVYPTQVVRVLQAQPRSVARALSHSIPTLRVAVTGSDLLLNGSPDDVAQARTAIQALDHAANNIVFDKVYRLHAVDAESVSRLLASSFRTASIQTDRELNAITVLASAATQDQIADAIAQLDVVPNAPGATNGGGGTVTDVITLRAAVPSSSGQASTSAADIAQSVSQALAGEASDLKIIVHPNSTRLILSGSTYSVQLAKDLIAKLDIAEPLVELDTEVYEVDDGLQKQLGIKFPTAALSTTYTEQTPATGSGGATGIINGLQPLSRTPLSLQAQLDFLVSTNRARILENPRITTFSGRTASLRAGETVNVLTTAGGGTGTVATTQIQSFQTGVTLDITPVVNTDDYVTVTLHPSVNTEAGISAAGVPNIQNRDTTTTVGLHDGQTIVVGGLIEDTDSRTVSKIPLLGELPLIGRLFQDVGTTHTRNELIVTVTPHILKDGFKTQTIERDLPGAPTAAPLPQLDASATLPPRRSREPSVAALTPAPTVGLTPASQAPFGASTPAPAASAFLQTNVYTFGTPPPNNYADPNQSPQIFYVRAEPTVVKGGQSVTLSAVTTSNVATLTLGSPASGNRQSLGSIGPGKWQGAITVNAGDAPAQSGNATMTLTAATSAGSSVSLQIPFSLVK